MLYFENIVFDYEGERFIDDNGKIFDNELSIPVMVNNNGECNYPIPFTIYRLDEERDPRIKPFHFDSKPFYTNLNKFTKTPLYDVPDIFINYLKDEEPTYGNFTSLWQQVEAEKEFDKEDLIDYFELQDKIAGLQSELDEFLDMPTDKRELYDKEEENIKEEIRDLEEDLMNHECNTWFEDYEDLMEEEIEK